MRYEVTFAPEAQEDFKSLSAYDRAAVRDAINRHLLHQPELAGKSRIKRLRAMVKPQYRLRVGEHRVFYDVAGTEVKVLAVVKKRPAAAWLQQWGTRS